MYHGSQTAGAKVRRREGKSPDQQLRSPNLCSEVKLDGAPFKAFAAQRETWAKETAYVYPGPIQYFGPTEVCDQPTKTLQLEQAK